MPQLCGCGTTLLLGLPSRVEGEEFMGCNRRKFIKIAGLSTLMGLGANSAFELLFPGQLEAAGYFTDRKGLEAERWGMVINMRQCATHHDCTKCMDACNRTHNIPDFKDIKHEVKWIWKAPYHNTFPSKENEFINEEIKHMPFVVLLQSLQKSALCPGLSDSGDF